MTTPHPAPATDSGVSSSLPKFNKLTSFPPGLKFPPRPCQAWSEYGACDAACEGKRTRTRTIRTEAVNSVPCNEFRLNESIPCGPVCKEDFCGDNEKWL